MASGSTAAREAGMPMTEPGRVETPAAVVYENVLDNLLATIREHVITRVNSYGMPTLDEVPKAVRTRLAWMKATEDDLAMTMHQTLFGSGDDVERRKQLRARLGECWVDMAAWLINRALRDEYPLARTVKEIAEDEAQAERE